MKIYDTDKEVYAKSTRIKPLKTRADLDKVLEKYGITDVWWTWNIKNNKVCLKFKVPVGQFEGTDLENISIIIEPHPIWHKNRRKPDTINWKATMRNMYWYIWTHLSQAYVNQTGAFAEFLQHALNHDGRKMIEVVRNQYALPEKINKKKVF